MKVRGFTLVELVVAITISSIVVVFAAMFIGAPLGAYEAQTRRAVLVADASGAWPRMETDLRSALPNSLRARRNGNFVVVEMFKVLDFARYTTPPSVVPFTIVGVDRAPGIVTRYLSVNPAADAYTLTGSIGSAAGLQRTPTGVSGGYLISGVAPIATVSPTQRIYFVEGPVTYLCDEGQGTLRRYANYNVAVNHADRDEPAELAGAGGGGGELITQGLTGCGFEAPAVAGNQLQSAYVRLTTTRSGDSMSLLHISRAEYLP